MNIVIYMENVFRYFSQSQQCSILKIVVQASSDTDYSELLKLWPGIQYRGQSRVQSAVMKYIGEKF